MSVTLRFCLWWYVFNTKYVYSDYSWCPHFVASTEVPFVSIPRELDIFTIPAQILPSCLCFFAFSDFATLWPLFAKIRSANRTYKILDFRQRRRPRCSSRRSLCTCFTLLVVSMVLATDRTLLTFWRTAGRTNAVDTANGRVNIFVILDMIYMS